MEFNSLEVSFEIGRASSGQSVSDTVFQSTVDLSVSDTVSQSTVDLDALHHVRLDSN